MEGSLSSLNTIGKKRIPVSRCLSEVQYDGELISLSIDFLVFNVDSF